MKITLDLTDLVARGKITDQEAARLRELAADDTGALGINILMGFGAIAVAIGAGVLVPTLTTVLVIGGILFAGGLAIRFMAGPRWDMFAQICMTIGALGLAGALSFLSDGSIWANLALCIGIAIAGVAARSGLLVALSVIGLTATMGGATAYWHATYGVFIPHPSITVVVLSALTLALYLASLRIPSAYERLAIIGARTAILMINVAFLVGSLFGDEVGELRIPDFAFSIVWALLLIGIALWAIRANRRWVVNMAAVFGAIHFYTQWFETLGASPFSVLAGGLLLIAFGFALKWLNNYVKARRKHLRPAVDTVPRSE